MRDTMNWQARGQMALERPRELAGGVLRHRRGNGLGWSHQPVGRHLAVFCRVECSPIGLVYRFLEISVNPPQFNA